MMLMGLRLEEGVSLSRYERLTGRALESARIDGLIRDGALMRHGDIVKATPEGRLVLNGVLGRLLA